MANEVSERILHVNLSAAYKKPKTKRGNHALKLLRSAIARHAKTLESAVSISNAVSSAVWNGRYQAPAKSIKVKLISEGDRIRAILPNEKREAKEKAKKEIKQSTEKKEPKEMKEEKHIGGERKTPETKKVTEEEKLRERELKDLQKMKK